MQPVDRLDAAFNALSAQQFELARSLFTKLAAKDPADPRPKLGLADALFRLGHHAASLYHAELAAKLCGDDEVLTAKAADSLCRAGKTEEGITLLEEACRKNPSWAVARTTLGNFYCMQERVVDAERLLREALGIDPDITAARSGLASALASQGRSDEAAAIYRKLLWEQPDDQNLLELLAFLLNSADASPTEVFQAHVRLGMHFVNFASDVRLPHPATDDPDRRLTVGIVTHDFNSHSVSFFLEPLLRNLDRTRLSISVYFTNSMADATTTALRTYVDDYQHLPNISSVDLAKKVHADRVDILIDLNGWTSGHRLHAFQLRPAPVQMTYLGYPNTSGIPNIDYRIVDSITDPPGYERLATESLLRLDPCFLCYTPITDRPAYVAPGWKPPEREALDTGRPIVFGSFNNATKITDTALIAWKAVLERVPDSRLFIKARGLKQQGARTAFEERLARAGIAAERCQTMPQTKHAEDHLAMYSAVDIALDTFPYNGTTTTCESLLMGVPVVTLVGDRHVSRVGASLVSAIGHADLAAADVEGYIDRCVRLASERGALAAMHRELPGRFRASPLCNGKAFALRFAELMNFAWRQRCLLGVGAAARNRTR